MFSQHLLNAPLISLLIVAAISISGVALLSVLPLDTARPAATEGRLQAEIDVLLGVEADNEGGDVDDLLPDPDVSLPNEDTGVVDGLGQPQLEHLGLETTLQEVLNLEAENIVELHLALVEDTDPDQATQQRVALEQPLGVLLLEGEEDPGGGPHLGEAVLDAPHLPLVPQPVLSDQLQLLVQPSLLEGPC